jgi:hypothetical protein
MSLLNDCLVGSVTLLPFVLLKGDAKLPPVEMQEEEANSGLKGAGIEV